MSQKHFSREGFKPLENTISKTMTNPNDATIDIPLTTVGSRGQTGARKFDGSRSPSAYRPPTDILDPNTNEKAGHFNHGPGGRRRKISNRDKVQKGGEDATLTAMGKVYNTILNFSVLIRYIVYVTPIAFMIAVPVVVGATVAQKASIGGVRIVWFFTWIEVVWLSLWISRLVAQFLPFLFQFLCGIVSAGTRKYSLILTALEMPLSLFGWTLTSLTTFVPLMTLNPDNRNQPHGKDLTNWEKVVKNILFACCVSSILLLAEKLLIQLISIGYHRKQFDSKIKDSKRNIFLLSLLYDASRTLFPEYCAEFAPEDYIINDSLDLNLIVRSKAGSKFKSGSATPMRLVQNVGRVGDKVTAAFGNVAHEITGKEVFNPTSAHSIVVEALEKKSSSEALARRLWMSFVMEGTDALHHEDVLDVLGEDRSVEAEECFTCLDRDGNGDISLEEMILTVCEFGRERHSIAHSMHDVDQAINILDNLLCTAVTIIVAFVFVGFLNSSFTTTLATAGTALLSLSFVFAATAQEVLGSCIFLFVKHPFDVGDRVDIGENQLTVERISLLFTVFRKIKDHKTTQVPNIVLNTNWIDNITRSKAMREQISLFVSFDTTLEDIQLLKNEMSAFITDKDNSRDFQADVDIEVIGIAEMNKLELRIEIRHKSNWSNEAVRAARRSKFMCALVLSLRKVPIYGPAGGDAALGEIGKPTYSVAVSNEEAAANRKEFLNNKDKKRMVPLDDPEPDIADVQSPASATLGMSSSVDYIAPLGSTSSKRSRLPEAALVETLNSRRPAVDPAHDDANDYYGNQETVNELTKAERRRSNDIEEVRDLLRKESLTGRRRALAPSGGNPLARQPTIQEAITPPARSQSRPGAQRINYPDHQPSEQLNMTGSPQSSVYQNNNPFVRRAISGTIY